MREMVLNHASLSGFTSKLEVTQLLKDTADGMAILVENDVTVPILRTYKPEQEIVCIEGFSLFDAYVSLVHAGEKDNFSFLMGLSSKSPLLKDISEEFADRMITCELADLPPEDGAPILLCALTEWVAVGFPKELWDNDQLNVRFEELLPDETFETVEKKIDNLTRSSHANSIAERHQLQIRSSLNLHTLWKYRKSAFPNLIFGPDVETQLTKLPLELSYTVLNRLGELNSAAKCWLNDGGSMPNWKCKVTPENTRVNNNKKLREARRFQSNDGSSKLYMWHARFGDRGRIHLCFDPSKFEVEIGYIGWHLPL